MADDIARLLRAAKSGTARRRDPLSSRALAELVAYERQERAPGNRRARARAGWRPLQIGSAVALAMAMVTVVVLAVLEETPAAALTPPMLRAEAVSASASELLQEMALMNREQPRSGNAIRSQTWALNTEIAPDGSITSSSTEPQWNEIIFHKDGSVRQRLVAADPFPGQSPKALAAPGTVIADEIIAAGDYQAPYSDVPAEPASVGEYLARFAGEDNLTAGASIIEISSILSSTLLSEAQESACLAYLATLAGISAMGTVTDRLGRTGVAFRADDRVPGEVEDILIISPESGRILAIETIYIGSGRDDIASPSVVNYTAWER